MKLEKWTGLLKKYRYAALIVLAGMVLMLLPTGGGKADSGGDSSEAAESFSLEETEKRMAEVLGTINGVGCVPAPPCVWRRTAPSPTAPAAKLSRKSRCSPSIAAADGRRWW